jgi:hypothetical protein
VQAGAGLVRAVRLGGSELPWVRGGAAERVAPAKERRVRADAEGHRVEQGTTGASA